MATSTPDDENLLAALREDPELGCSKLQGQVLQQGFKISVTRLEKLIRKNALKSAPKPSVVAVEAAREAARIEEEKREQAEMAAALKRQEAYGLHGRKS